MPDKRRLDESAEWTGHRWLPEEPDRVIPGVLRYDPRRSDAVASAAGSGSNPQVVALSANAHMPRAEGVDGSGDPRLGCREGDAHDLKAHHSADSCTCTKCTAQMSRVRSPEGS
jgi:hypothetical protein